MDNKPFTHFSLFNDILFSLCMVTDSFMLVIFLPVSFEKAARNTENVWICVVLYYYVKIPLETFIKLLKYEVVWSKQALAFEKHDFIKYLKINIGLFGNLISTRQDHCSPYGTVV